MFTHRHYVPVLRWKRGERWALGRLADGDRRMITPLIEFTPRDFESWTPGDPSFLDRKLTALVTDVATNWGGGPIFLDLGLLNPAMIGASGRKAIEIAADQCRTSGVAAVPVGTIAQGRAAQSTIGAAARVIGTGTALRLRQSDLGRPDLRSKIAGFTSASRQPRSATDLIVDLQIANGARPTLREILGLVGDAREWRTLTVISGAFPKNLSGFSVGEHEHARSDWVAWRDEVLAGKRLARIPTFGDYTTQHGLFAEPPRRANFSASIRYTADDYWVIMRGEGVLNDSGPGYAQWPANAQLLCERPEFCGPEFSIGDEYIHEMAQQTARPGNAETWLRAGVNHHMAFTARQIATLFGT